MTKKELQKIASETLSYFMEVMPDVPFAEDDVVFDFARQKNMDKQAKALCEKYKPDKIINDSQAQQLNSTTAANALIGKNKSAVLACLDCPADRKRWRMIFFHEFMHIYSAKIEMEELKGNHFIDIYGSGHTPEENPENLAYDGIINAGHVVWSEFIAQYYALIKTRDHGYDFATALDFVGDLLYEVSFANDENSKTSFYMAAAYLLSSDDIGDVMEQDVGFFAEGGRDSHEASNNAALFQCLRVLNEQLQQDNPCKISLEFIEILGSSFTTFKTTNSLYLGQEELMREALKRWEEGENDDI